MRILRFSPYSDPEGGLREIAPLGLNYDPAETDEPGWHHDRLRHPLGAETPGDAVPGGVFEVACRLVRDYEFADPAIMHAYFHRDGELVGRNMLLEGHFLVLRFPMGVRVDAEVDETRMRADGTSERSWGWSYRTLEHHLERGRLVYEVVKNLDTGTVEFVITGVSRRGKIPNPIIAVGFTFFGRWTQWRFYRAAVKKLERLVARAMAGYDLPTPDPIGSRDVVVAPSRG